MFSDYRNFVDLDDDFSPKREIFVSKHHFDHTNGGVIVFNIPPHYYIHHTHSHAPTFSKDEIIAGCSPIDTVDKLFDDILSMTKSHKTYNVAFMHSQKQKFLKCDVKWTSLFKTWSIDNSAVFHNTELLHDKIKSFVDELH